MVRYYVSLRPGVGFANSTVLPALNTVMVAWTTFYSFPMTGYSVFSKPFPSLTSFGDTPESENELLVKYCTAKGYTLEEVAQGFTRNHRYPYKSWQEPGAVLDLRAKDLL